MDIPQKIKVRIAEIILENEKLEEIAERTKSTEVKRLKKIDNLRQRRYVKLYTAADFVLQWLVSFWESDAAKEIFRLRKEVVIFRAHFWLGEPAPKADIATRATFNMCRPPENYKEATLEYRELHKGHISYSKKMGYSFTDYDGETWKQAELVNNLHPDFLLQFAEAIKSGKVWDYVESSLR